MKSTQPHGTASVQSRKAQTYVPVRDKVRSQPGREDHQAYRNSKGVITTLSEGDRDNATLCLSQDVSGSDCRDHKSSQMTESWKSEERDSKSIQSLVLQVSKEHHPMRMMR